MAIPILWWKFEDNLIDTIVGLVANGTPSYANGYVGKGFYVNNWEHTAGYTASVLNVTNNSIFNFTPFDKFSIRFWLKITGNTRLLYYPVRKGNIGTGTVDIITDYGFKIDDIDFNSHLYDLAGAPTSGVITKDIWHDVLGTYNNGVIKTYLDGIDVSLDSSARYITNSNYALHFITGTQWMTFSGIIDEIRFYNKVITINNDDTSKEDPMVPTFQKLNVLIAKQQSALGTKAPAILTVTDNLAAIDDSFELTYKKEFAEQSLAQGIFGQPQSVGGMSQIDAKIKMPVIPTGSSTVPSIGPYLNSCGMTYALATKKHSWTPSSVVGTDWHDMSLNGYTGDKTTGDSILTKAHSAMFDVEISGEIGKEVTAVFTGKAVPDGVPAAASYITGTIPVLSTAVPAVMKNATQTINGLTMHVLKFALKIGNDVQLIKSMGDDSGNGQAMIVGRKSSLTCTVYMEDASTNNPLTGMAAGTLATTTIKFGPATDSLISITSGSSKSEIVDCKPSVDNGLMCWDISINFVDNSVTLAINDA
jgi:hypothetical protein